MLQKTDYRTKTQNRKGKIIEIVVFLSKPNNSGELLDRSEANLIGVGGQGKVYKGMWHSKPAAFKVNPVHRSKAEDVHSAIDTLKQQLIEVYKLQGLATKKK